MERSGMVLQLLDLSSFCRRSLAAMEPTTLICKSIPPTIDKKRQRRFEIFYSVFLCLHKEINASRFSGPEQFSAGAPLISHLFSKKCELFCPHFPSRHFWPDEIQFKGNTFFYWKIHWKMHWKIIWYIEKCTEKYIEKSRFIGEVYWVYQVRMGRVLIMLKSFTRAKSLRVEHVEELYTR